jgi:hypothetical protein
VKEYLRVNDVKNNPCTESSHYIQSKCIMLCVYESTMTIANTTCGYEHEHVELLKITDDSKYEPFASWR